MVPVALQLYTLRELTQRDFVGTLREVARLGFAGVEFAGYGGLTAEELKSLLDELGLQAAGSHVGLDALENELEAVIAYNKTIGNRNIVCPWLSEERRVNYRQVAQSLNSIGRTLREHGLQLLYHNHDFEFDRFEGRTGLEILFSESDPDLVQAELDVYWVQRGGDQPAAWLNQLGKRCPLVHLKDMTPAPDHRFAPVGTGMIDFEAIFAASANTAQWYIVEQDDTYGLNPLEAVKISIENLRSAGGLYT